MYNSVEDVTGYAVHQVEIDGKKRWVNCLREYNQSKDVCPFCREGKFVTAKLFVPIYNVDEDKTQIWERGKKFISKISSICARYPDVVSHKFEIERNGKPGDTQTVYEIYEVGKDETTLEDLPEQRDVLGTVVLDKSAEDMEYFLEEGYFPPEDDTPVRRKSRNDDDEEVPFEENRRGSRRTPANSRRDRF